MAAVLEPLHFLLPQREAWPPELAVTTGSGGVTSEMDPERSDPTPSSSDLRDAEDSGKDALLT